MNSGPSRRVPRMEKRIRTITILNNRYAGGPFQPRLVAKTAVRTDRNGFGDLSSTLSCFVIMKDKGRQPPSKSLNRNFLTLHAADSHATLKGISSPIRIDILRLLHDKGPMNVNEISAALAVPAVGALLAEPAFLLADAATPRAAERHTYLPYPHGLAPP